MQRVFNAAAANPLMIPPDLMSYILDYIQTSRLQIPIGQVPGFVQFTAQVASPIATNESTASTSYTDLATVGPSLEGLPDGSYLVLFGAYGRVSAATGGTRMSIDVNGAGATDSDAVAWNITDAVSTSSFFTTRIMDGSNSMIAKYRADSPLTGTFADRRLLALRFAN